MEKISDIFKRVLKHIFKRGKGAFKFLFVIDDVIRLFSTTILLPIFVTKLGGSNSIKAVSIFIGLIFDFQNIVSNVGKAQQDLEPIRKLQRKVNK